MYQHRPDAQPDLEEHAVEKSNFVEDAAFRQECSNTLIDAEAEDVEEQEQEEKDFDPYACGKRKNAISFWPAVTHTFIAAASPTLMNVPSTFGQVGYVVGVSGSLIVVLFYASCMHTLLAVEYTLCKRLRKPNLTYAEVIYHAFASGPKRWRWRANLARLLVYADFLCIWGGSNAINALLASENVKSVYDHFFNTDVNIRVLMLCLSGPLVALCWIPNLKMLAFCSGAANVLNISCIIIILYVSLIGLPPSSSLLASRHAFGDGVRIPLFLGVILITMNSTGIIMPLKNEMKKPASMSSKLGVLNTAYLPTAFLYSIFGLLCYLRYGENVNENIILNLADTNLGQMVVCLYTASIILTYPLASYVAFDTVWNNILKDKVRRNDVYSVKKYLCRTLVAMSSIALAFVVPDVTLFVSLAGNLGVSLDSIIFPALAELLVESSGTKGRKRNWVKWCKNITYIFLGIVLCVISVFDSVSGLIQNYF